MKSLISLFFLLIVNVAHTNVIDLGDLSIEGEVRRPLITTIQAPQYTKELAKKSARRSFDQLVDSTFSPYSTEAFVKIIKSGQELKEEVLK